MHRVTTVCLFILTVLLLASCGSAPQYNSNEAENITVNEPIQIRPVSPTEEAVSTVRTLSIMARECFVPPLHQAAAALQAEWDLLFPERNYILQLALTTYNASNAEDLFNATGRLHTMLMAGEGYDLFFQNHIPASFYARSGLMTDVYTLIAQNPNTQLEDFFHQPLQALEYRGGLYSFPLNFGFVYVFINENLPSYFIERFTNKENITLREMMRLYNDLMHEHGSEFSHLFFAEGNFLIHSPSLLFRSYIGGYIDLENHQINVTEDSFIAFLHDLYTLNRNGRIMSMFSSVPIMGNDILRDVSSTHVFTVQSSSLNPALAFIDELQHFAHGIPLADNQGKLILDIAHLSSATWAILNFPAVGDSTLAWEFTQHLITAFTFPQGHLPFGVQVGGTSIFWGQYSVSTPIKRRYFEPHITQSINYTRGYGHSFLQADIDLRNDDTMNAIVENAIRRLALYNDMPMSTLYGSVQSTVFESNLALFLYGVLSVEEFVLRLESALQLWLMEQ
ncbi:MAG: hypothetical protein FWC16_14510 [Defluviitaleaceae bacterium]|nr:hypothetical protein [Defluviitaleaceae bacterium]MCL2276127.1 hypothetical protein [Defluviitaleaceae bacterium]